MSHIPYGRQDVSETDIQNIIKVLQSDWLTQGPITEQFEQAVANYCGAAYAVAVNSATSALHIACLALELGENDILWTSPNTFVASANCALYCGAQVDFVDIDPQTYNMSVSELAQKLAQAELEKRLPKVIVPVHFSGQSCDMEPIYQLARQYGCKVIEDASHGIGGYYQGNKVGSCQYSDMAVYSFHPVKIITTGEGGMVTTNNRSLYEKLIRLRSHGITRNPELMVGKTHGGWYYQQLELGLNYRMTEIQAALGLSQLQRIDEFVVRRNEIAARYNHELKDLPLVLPHISSEVYSSWHLYVVKLKRDIVKKSRKQVYDELRNFNIGVNVHYIPVHTQPYYQKMGFKAGDFPQAEQYYEDVITLPIFSSLTLEKQQYVIQCLHTCLQED